ncbi:exocyst complex component 3-like [Plectropomus leopardus]|uniref:exocyst complex component 3-like n=1 Tax=Plectropomus leopardus TaxID=160734 RepID=UPI001C4DC706|nr:exocyst complex component 3-like [Plectropomus leopardus]
MRNIFKTRSQRSDIRSPLIENNNNNNIQENEQNAYEQAATGFNNPVAQDAFNIQEEQSLRSEGPISLPDLAELLCVAPDVNTASDRSCCSMGPEPNSRQQSIVGLIQRSVHQHIPEPPADVDTELQQHLLNVQESVCKELVKLGPLLESRGLMGLLIDCYHRETFRHLNGLLQNISSSQNSFVLMKWVLHTYLSPELLSHPDLQKMDLMKKVDFLLFTEWVEKAKAKLLENVQEEVRGQLDIIMHIKRGDEADDELHVDTIQCIEAMPTEALKISPKLSDHVQKFCLQELFWFLERYTDKQAEILEKMAKMDKPEMKHFFQTLNNCKKLKLHVLTKAKGNLLNETVFKLENMEAFTLKLLMEIVADIAESHLKKYFRSENKEFFFLVDAVKGHFSELSHFQEIQKSVMDEVYKLIAHSYLKHLIQRSQRKLERGWSRDVGKQVWDDATLLHDIISNIVPGVRQWNTMLLEIKELVDCKSLDMLELTVGKMYKECPTWSEDLELLPSLLRWNGLYRWQVTEVLKVLEVLDGYEPRPRSASWYSCLPCC